MFTSYLIRGVRIEYAALIDQLAIVLDSLLRVLDNLLIGVRVVAKRSRVGYVPYASLFSSVPILGMNTSSG